LASSGTDRRLHVWDLRFFAFIQSYFSFLFGVVCNGDEKFLQVCLFLDLQFVQDVCLVMFSNCDLFFSNLVKSVKTSPLKMLKMGHRNYWFVFLTAVLRIGVYFMFLLAGNLAKAVL
jgi:hypothetical protein